MLAKDQAGNQRQTWTDALGRLVQVIEDPGSSPHKNYVTNYTYDALDDLQGVNQSGQLRSFTYDSVKRLVGATNPENYSAGTAAGQSCGGGSYAICYTYDNVGNLLTKTDNRSAKITHTYDSLNRITSKAYTVPSGVAATPTVTYCYDAIYTTSCPTTGTVGYLGRLTAMTNGNSTDLYTNFDALGRVLNHSQVTGTNTYPFIYTYNRAGALTSQTYPSGRVVNTCYDGANRVSQVGLSACPSTVGSGLGLPAYATGTTAGTGIQYAPQGAPWLYVMGNNVWHATAYNGRLQECGIQEVLAGSTWSAPAPLACGSPGVTGGTQYLNATLNWGTANDNGNLQGATYVHQGGPGLSSPLDACADLHLRRGEPFAKFGGQRVRPQFFL